MGSVDLGSLLQGAGNTGLGLALLAAVWLLTGGRKDRRNYDEAIERAEKRATAAEKRAADADAERDLALYAKRKAEDTVAEMTRQLTPLREQVARLTAEQHRLIAEVEGLRAQLKGAM